MKKGKKSLPDRAVERAKNILQNHKPDIPSDLQREIRDYLSEVMDREGVRKDEAKKIMDQTYI